jgi:[CysO sulfur-carrier protein]-S-L-cysteine hydrolase
MLNEMIAEARAAAPHECCGLLAGKNGQVTHHYRIKNIVASEGAEVATFDAAKIAHLQRLSPEDRADIAFVMDAQEMSVAFKDMRTNQLELQVIYHSHPHSPARPSHTDIANATEFESVRKILNLPEPLHLIISLENPATPASNAFRIVAGTATPVTYKIA